MPRWLTVGAGGVLLASCFVLSAAPSPQVAAATTVSCDAPTGSPPAAEVRGGFHGHPPTRLADTRPDEPVPAGCWLRVTIPVSVPADAAAIVVTLTAVDAPEAGFLTAHGCDWAVGSTSNLNVDASLPTSNLAIVQTGPSREVCVYTAGRTDVLVDLVGWFGPGGSPLNAMDARRVLDTRTPFLRPPEVDGILEPGERVTLDRAALEVPAEATAVLATLTTTQPEGWGFLSAFPCAGGLPPTSNVNYDQGISRAGTAIVALDADGALCLELGAAAAHVIVDVVAWFGDDGFDYDIGTRRVADTRVPGGPWSGRFAAGETRTLDAIGEMPLGTEVAILGIVSTRSTMDGFVQVSPCGTPTETSSMNFVAGSDITNLVAVPVADDGTVCVTASAPTDLVIDVFGGFGEGRLVKELTVGPLELFPPFDREITDYVAYCPDETTNSFDVTLAGPPGTTVDLAGSGSGVPTLEATQVLAADDALVAMFSSPTGAEAEYWIRCLPPDFPQVTVDRVADTTPGWYLVGHAGFTRPPGGFAIILDDNGVPVWYRRVVDSDGPLRVLLDVKRWSDGSIAAVAAAPTAWGLDPALGYERFALDGTPIATHKTIDNPLDPGVPRPTDHHDLVEMSNGNILLASYPARTTSPPTTYDCVSPGSGGGTTSDTVLDLVIQEIDPDTGTLVKEWSADVFGPTPKIDIGPGGSGAPAGEVTTPLCFGVGGTTYYDPIHLNGIAVSADDSQVFFSARHLDAVFAIDWTTDEIDWKLGGTATPESLALDPGDGPTLQHDVQVLPNGNVSVFDNNAPAGPARYAEYEIDASSSTATLVRSIDHPDGFASGAMGSARLQPDGGVVIGWGALPGPVFTEFDASGEAALAVSLDGLISYRAVKEPVDAFDLAELRSTAGG